MTNPLADIAQYPAQMTIAQLLKFFEKKALNISRAMVQNYIRIGILPKPVNGRFYTHKHIAALVIIDRLKALSDFDLVRRVLVPLYDGEGLALDAFDAAYAQSAHMAAAMRGTLVSAAPLAALVAVCDLVAHVRGG